MKYTKRKVKRTWKRKHRKINKTKARAEKVHERITMRKKTNMRKTL
jgi:hypothetical protein